MASHDRADDAFAAGLQLNRLHPPAIITFMQGLTRRAMEALAGVDAESQEDATAEESDSETRGWNGEALDPLLDTLASAVQRLQEAGFAPDHDVEDHAPKRVEPDSDLGHVNAAAIQVARLVAGVPDRAWTEQQNLLDDVRALCAQASAQLAALESQD